MRIALVPLDSRPANRQFPARLADLAGIELFTPPRNMLGDLHAGADGLELARWLVDTANSRECDAVVFSWDALIYGGLIQSRQMSSFNQVKDLQQILRDIDLERTKSYSFITVPRLGISVTSSDKAFTHQTVREYLIELDKAEYEKTSAHRAKELADLLGEQNIEMLGKWRKRNRQHAFDAVLATAQLGHTLCHVAVEDNAPEGPHIREVADLRRNYLLLRRDYSELRCTFFDGADECCSMLIARASADARGNTPLPVQLTVHPDTPGPERYTGRFETHTLEDGLGFLGKFLGLHYHYASRDRHWLVVHGKQPQPDLFEEQPRDVFNNPFLLPKSVPAGGQLFVSDLAACNGANPLLPECVSALTDTGPSGIVGFNTNFNTLGVTAALVRLAPNEPNPGLLRFLIERLADDVVYQSIARPLVIQYLISRGLDPMDFSAAHPLQVRECEQLCLRCWRAWIDEHGVDVLRQSGVSLDHALQIKYKFPWLRAFEVEVTLDF